jgi:hypothetical protein
MEERNWGGACTFWIAKQQEEVEGKKKKMKKLCLHLPNVPLHGVTYTKLFFKNHRRENL